jgi:large subunit ribosomal protein L31
MYKQLGGFDFLVNNRYNGRVMKTDIHPKNYRPVVFQDLNDNTTILTRSTVEAEDKITLNGVEYPLVKVHISSSSHPFFTGEERIVDIEGRVDKFKARAEAAAKAKEAKVAKVAKPKPSSRLSSQPQKLGAIDLQNADNLESSLLGKAKKQKAEAQKLGSGEPAKTEEPQDQAAEE